MASTTAMAKCLSATFCFVLLLAVVSSTSHLPLRKRGDCSKNMPCKWEICPWSRRFSSRRMDCISIQNESCQCPLDSLCQPAPNMVEPLSSAGGAPFIKVEYNCARIGGYPNYRLTRSRYDVV